MSIDYSPVEFPQKIGQPWKNLYKDVLYTVGKINLWAFQWYIVSFFSPWAKFFMVHLVETGRGVKSGENHQSEFHVL